MLVRSRRGRPRAVGGVGAERVIARQHALQPPPCSDCAATSAGCCCLLLQHVHYVDLDCYFGNKAHNIEHYDKSIFDNYLTFAYYWSSVIVVKYLFRRINLSNAN